jgi:hypothetical protein
MATTTKDVEADAAPPPPPGVPTLTATGDPLPPAAQPLILNDCYFEVNGVNLRCLVKHLEINPTTAQVPVVSFCGESDMPGATKWALKATFHQSFDTGATYATLNAAYNNYITSGTLAQFKARPKSSQLQSATNPVISGYAIPTANDLLVGDAGALAEVAIEWAIPNGPNVDSGAVTATGAAAGTPGYFTPSGATTPANLAALTGLTASPATNWTAGQYVITADLLAANWNGTTWVAGKHP